MGKLFPDEKDQYTMSFPKRRADRPLIYTGWMAGDQKPSYQPSKDRDRLRIPALNQKKIWLMAILGISLAVGIATVIVLLFKGSPGQMKGNPQSAEGNLPADPAPAPAVPQFPFSELTLPYLRGRQYDSALSDLRFVSESQSYTSYLTSYQSDGFRINGQLTIPKGQSPLGGWPAVVFVHGYIPPGQYRTLVNYASYVDFLARQGLVVFKIDLRGHDQSEGEPGGSYYSGDYVIDTLNAFAALKKAEFVDPDRIGLWGHSMAGNVVFRSFVAMPEIKRVVIWAGAVYTYEDFSQFRISDRSYQPPAQDSERRRKRDELFNLYGQFSPESEFWRQVPATNYLDGVTGAIEVHHARDDAVVEIGYSRNLMDVLNGTDISHQLFEYPSGGHNLTGSTFTQAMQRTADFFKQ